MANAIVEVIPQSAFCKLETQSNGVVCFQIQSPENQENKWYKIRSKSEGLRTRSTDLQKWEERNIWAQAESELTPPPPFGLFQVLKRIDDAQLR